MNVLENNHRLKGEDGGFGASRLFLWEELLPHWGSSSSFKSSSSCSLESSRNTWKGGGNRDRSVILLLMVPSECPACAHLPPSCSGDGTHLCQGALGRPCSSRSKLCPTEQRRRYVRGPRSSTSRWSYKSAYNTNLQEFCDGRGSLACCSPWGHKELDTTEQLN